MVLIVEATAIVEYEYLSLLFLKKSMKKSSGPKYEFLAKIVANSTKKTTVCVSSIIIYNFKKTFYH